MKIKIYLTLQFHFIFSNPLKRDYLLEETGASRHVTTSDSPPTDLSTCLVANKRGAALLPILYIAIQTSKYWFLLFFFSASNMKKGKEKIKTSRTRTN